MNRSNSAAAFPDGNAHRDRAIRRKLLNQQGAAGLDWEHANSI
jgi:hypothetical protein